MLKRFNKFLHPTEHKVNKIDFTPFVMRVDDKVLQVMRATNNDIPGLLLLEKEVYSGKTPWSEGAFESELSKTENSLYLVVYYESELIAMIGARFFNRETHITNIAVALEFQGKHIGTDLLELVIERAKANKHECVSLEVNIENEQAKSLYRHLGFKDMFIRKNYYQDTNTDAINMILWLNKNKNS